MPATELRQIENSQVELSGEIVADEFEKYYSPALEHLNRETAIKGFRPGHVPDEVLRRELGEEKILNLMAELVLKEEYPRLLAQHKIDAIGRPLVTITKLARHNPLGYKIVTAVFPQFTLPDCRKLAAAINQTPLAPVVVAENEIEKLLAELKNHSELKNKDPEELKRQAGDYLKFDQERRQQDKRRLEIIEAIDRETRIILPDILVEAELDKMLGELKSQVQTMGLTFEKYLAQLKKTEAELRTDWREQAGKRARTGLLLEKIAETEKLAPAEEKIEAETARLREHYPDQPPENLKSYAASMLKNEAVWAWLESR